MKAMQAAAAILFNVDDAPEWDDGLLFMLATRKLEDGRSYVLAVGNATVMLFVDHPEPDQWYAWALEEESESPDAALIFMDETKHYTSLADFIARGFTLFKKTSL